MNSTNVIPLHATGDCRVGHGERLIIDQAEYERHERAARFFKEVEGQRETVNRFDHELADLGRAQTSIKAEHATLRHEISRPMLPPWFYWTVLIGAAILEIPLNETALKAMRLTGTKPFVVAVFLAVLTVFAASYVGRAFRHIEGTDAYVKDWAVLAIVLAAVVTTALAVSYKRAEFMALDRETALDWMDVGTFWAMQILFFSIGTALAFAARHRSTDLERVNLDGRNYDKRLQERWKERAKIAGTFNRSLAVCKAELARIETRAIKSVDEYRWEIGRNGRSAPIWMQQSVTRAVFVPIELGTALDANPSPVHAVVNVKED